MMFIFLTTKFILTNKISFYIGGVKSLFQEFGCELDTALEQLKRHSHLIAACLLIKTNPAQYANKSKNKHFIKQILCCPSLIKEPK